MADLRGRGLVRTISREIKNVAKLNLADIENAIEYLMHIDHELPMDLYLKLEPLKKDLANLVVVYSDKAVKLALNKATYMIASKLEDEVGNMVYDTTTIEREYIEVPTTRQVESGDIEKIMGGE